MPYKCSKCGEPITEEYATKTTEKFGRALCENCVFDESSREGQAEDAKSAPGAPDKEPTQIDKGEANVAPVMPLPVNAVHDVTGVNHDETGVVTYAQTSAIIQYTPKQVETIKNTVAKGISDSELEMFMHLCQVYGLDPFLKEIFYSAKMKTIMTSRDGYLKVAQRDPAFSGIQSMAVCENDDFTIDAVAPTIKHVFGKGDRGKVIGAWAIVHRTRRKPVISYADIREYDTNINSWVKYKSAMICKVAEAFSLKRQFGISGLVTTEEMEG